MADDLPEAEATTVAPLKLTRPPSPQKINSNTCNAGLDDSAMAHTGSVKRVRSFDGDDQDEPSNTNSPKRPRLVEEGNGPTANCKEPNINNKDNGDPTSSLKECATKKDHLTSNGALDKNKDRESPIDCSKENSEASIDGASDADVSSQAESETVDKDEDNVNGKSMEVDGTEYPKNGATSEHLGSEGKSSSFLKSNDQDELSESNLKSTSSETKTDCVDKDRTGYTEKSGNKLCDTNAKECDDMKKANPKEFCEDKMEVDGAVDTKQESKEDDESANGVDTSKSSVKGEQSIEEKNKTSSSKDEGAKDDSKSISETSPKDSCEQSQDGKKKKVPTATLR